MVEAMRLRPILVLASGALVAASLVAPGASAVTSTADTQVAAIAARDANKEITFLAGLPRDSAVLQSEAVKRSTPGELEYRDHPTLAAAAKAYGAKTSADGLQYRSEGNGTSTELPPRDTVPEAPNSLGAATLQHQTHRRHDARRTCRLTARSGLTSTWG